MHVLPLDKLIHDRYRIVRFIGGGGMGAVYEAIDTRLSSRVALKQTAFGVGFGTTLTTAYRKAFEHEAKLLANLRHPALPVVIDYFQENDEQFLVMQYISGEDFDEMLHKREAPFPVQDVLEWADQILEALEYLHRQQPPVIHRDIKPANLKLTDTDRIMLLDFGLAKGVTGLQSQLTTGSSIPGYTPQYAPLEQIHASGTDPRTDLYALGGTLYHLLTSIPPTDALMRATSVTLMHSDPLLPPHEAHPQVPISLSMVVMQSLALWNSARPTSAKEMRAALKAVRQEAEAGIRDQANASLVTLPAPSADLRQRVASPTQTTSLDDSLLKTESDSSARSTSDSNRNLRRLLWAVPLLVVIVALALFGRQRFNGLAADPVLALI
jgi:serine/threonine protein kinase